MKKNYGHVILSMKFLNYVVISMVTRIQLNIYDYMIRKWSLVIFVLVINVKFWCSGICKV